MKFLETEEKKVISYLLLLAMVFTTISPVSYEIYHITSHTSDIVKGSFHYHTHASSEVGHSHLMLKYSDESDSGNESQSKQIMTDLTIKVNKIFNHNAFIINKLDRYNLHCFGFRHVFSTLHKEIFLPPPNKTLV